MRGVLAWCWMFVVAVPVAPIGISHRIGVMFGEDGIDVDDGVWR